VPEFKTSEGTYSLAKVPTNSTAEFDWLGKNVKQAAIRIPIIAHHERAVRTKENTIIVKTLTTLAHGDDAPQFRMAATHRHIFSSRNGCPPDGR
jgi:hypothetical protein